MAGRGTEGELAAAGFSAAAADRAASQDRGASLDLGTALDPETLQRLAAAASGELRLVELPGGAFRMGSDDALAYPEDGEGPVRTVTLQPFAIAATTVTIADFAVFVLDTGYVTDAERFGNALVFGGLLPEELRAHTPRVAATPWWHQIAGASWHHPEGPGSTAEHRTHHPVTQVSQRDAVAYAEWVGARLPTEAEWEFASRGGLDQQPFPWGTEREPDGVPRMNTFVGRFPDAPTAPVGTVAADAFAPNGYGLYNTTGNVWEWTTGVFSASDDRPVMRGGSYLCHASYCRRYRTSARTAVTADTSLGHAGFRLALHRSSAPSSARSADAS
ncbi:formylglycine-generating enzyme family protein [Leucobacter coleopterorum]|uniref:formylglycine-generating enzyme family protein n=1 Tax=Leucobacter coleopterorum TaxID=2714933 RepID=UPI001FCAA006|nr:formylglycine-generating enzyme family protein [Leucobacter coleopterorum]